MIAEVQPPMRVFRVPGEVWKDPLILGYSVNQFTGGKSTIWVMDVMDGPLDSKGENVVALEADGTDM